MNLKLEIDIDQLSEGAEKWYRSLTPAERGVYLQALWECEGEPTPRTDEERRARTQAEGGAQ